MTKRKKLLVDFYLNLTTSLLQSIYALRCSYERCGDCVPACRQSALAGNLLRFVTQRTFEITA